MTEEKPPVTRMDALIETCTDYQELAGAEMTGKNKKAVKERAAELPSLTEMADFTGGLPSPNGRPMHQPTDQTRALVVLMVGMGANETDISLVIGISRNTLRKHYEAELVSGAAKMDYHVYSAMYKAIAKGKTDMIKLYLERRKGWKADDVDPNVSVNVSVTIDDIVKEISSKPHTLPKFTKDQFIDHERKPDAPVES